VAAGPAPTREELRSQLVAARLAGEVATPRANSLDHFRRLADGDPEYLLGLDLDRRWSYERVVALMAERSGAPADRLAHVGPDVIDPDRTVGALDRMGERLRRAAAAGRRVLLATGHPSGLLGTHLAVARALVAAGAELVEVPAGIMIGHGEVRQLEGVAALASGGGLQHTHAPDWMELVLGRLAAAGQPPPDLVVADHGWTGYAGRVGIEAVGFADCNDPALFVGEAEGAVAVAVPIEDNFPFSTYRPMNAYLTAAITGDGAGD
jgi:Phosphatase